MTGLPDTDVYDTQHVLTSDALHRLPDELQHELYKAVEVADFERVMESIQQIRQYNAELAEVLVKIVNEYQFHRLHILYPRRDDCR